MGIAYSVACFIACGIFIVAMCAWSAYRVDQFVDTTQELLGLGIRWERTLRLAAYCQIAMMALAAIGSFVFAAAVFWMAAS